jgi:hypothetical protein
VERSQSPLGSEGYDIDIITGLPLEINEEEVGAVQKTTKILTDHQDLLADLSGGGGAVIMEITSLLADRINELISDDPVASAYAKVLMRVDRKVNYGSKIANNLVKRVSEQNKAARKDTGLE